MTNQQTRPDISSDSRHQTRPFVSWSTKDRVTFIFTVAIGIGSAILSFTQFPTPYNWPAAGFLALLTLWLAGEIWERVEEFRKLNLELKSQFEGLELRLPDTMQGILDQSLQGVTAQIRLFEDKDEFLRYKSQRVSSVRKKIFTTNFNDPSRRAAAESSRPGWGDYTERVRQKVRDENVAFNRVEVVRDQDHLDYLVQKMQDLKGAKYYIGCYTSVPIDLPLLDCMIFDDDEVCIGGYRGRDWALGEYNVAIRDRAVVKVLSDYARVLFGKSVILNGGIGSTSQIYQDRVERIRQQLTEIEHQPNIVVFLNREAGYTALIDNLVQARSSIDIVSYGQLHDPDNRRQDYYRELRTVVERGIGHRRIVWNLDHLKWLEERFAEGWDKLETFQVRFLSREGSEDLTTFDLIDGRKVIMGQGWRGPGHLQIGDESIAAFFESHFRQMWDEAGQYRIKVAGKPPDLDLLVQLKDQLTAAPAFSFIPDASKNYDVAQRLLDDAPPGSFISATSIFPASQRSGEASKRYGQLRDARIRQGDCHFMRIEAAYSEPDCRQIKEHVERVRGNCQNYELRIFPKKTKAPIYENVSPTFDCLLIIRPDESAEGLLMLPMLKGLPSAQAALHFRDVSMIRELLNYVRSLTNEADILLEDGRIVDEQLYAQLMTRAGPSGETAAASNPGMG